MSSSSSPLRSTDSIPHGRLVPVEHAFPQTFHIYNLGKGPYGFVLGEHQDKPLYLVSTRPSLYSNRPDIVLHSGLSTKAPPLASLTSTHFNSATCVSLPPRKLGDAHGKELLTAHDYLFGRYTFEAEVIHGPSDKRDRERFEWRRSHGKDVKALGAQSAGWKLVRMSGLHGRGPKAGDGNEVVAVCASRGNGRTKLFSFRFLGSGTLDPDSRWTVMAAMSGLCIFERERKRKLLDPGRYICTLPRRSIPVGHVPDCHAPS
ncbi:hypothetical protein B0T22DRAFT_474958 [Podospora appendiculata]|uniref:Uncharacterized protein n=1 Tax=Podospora appendiculata TaxID=314037 RepID=A0AAE0XEI7_9PEZI|nr:hypothetical protein B0T22DRAFT_474958 [Podospora appendiculata]